MIYIMYGSDDYSLNQELIEIKKSLGDLEMLSVNTSVIDGWGLTMTQLLEMCNCVPFLHPVRLVIVKGLLESFEKEAAGTGKGSRSKSKAKVGGVEWESAGETIRQISDTTTLVFIDGEITRKNYLLNKLAPIATVKVFPKLRGTEVNNWISRYIASKGGTITAGALNMLAGSIGGDLWTLSGEIEKLIIYTGERTINEKDVKQLTSYSKETSIFSLVDAVVERRRSDAHTMFHKLSNEGVTVPYIMAMITRQLRLIIMTKDLMRNTSQRNIQGRLGINSEFAMKKLLSQSEKYTIDQLKHAYRKLLEIDIAIKTGRYEGDIAVDLLVIELCS
jgi:DNA polymerase-3 subunit delta